MALGLPYLTLPDMRLLWIDRLSPTVADIDAIIAGMRAAKFGLPQELIATMGIRARP